MRKKNLSFNSIKVRLEPRLAVSPNWRYLFQFHKGTIRTFVMLRSVLVLLVFQFHKGTIRTDNGMNITFNQNIGFNSIKVRLERCCAIYY